MGILKSNMYSFIGRAIIGNNPVSRMLYPEFTDFKIVESDQEYRNIISATGELTFVNNNKQQVDDYDFIKSYEANSISTKISVDVLVDGATKYHGYFYPYQCVINDDRCTITVSLTTDDSYTCIDKYMDTQENILAETDAWGLFRIPTPVTFFYFECEQDIIIETQNATQSGCTIYYDTAGLLYLNIPVVGLPYNIVGFPILPAPVVTYYFAGTALAGNCLMVKFIDPLSLMSLGYIRADVLRVQKSEYTFLSWTGTTYTRPVDGAVLQKANVRVKTTWIAESVITQNNPITGAQNMPAGGGWMDYNQYILNGILVTRWFRIPYYNNQTYNYFKIVDNCNYQAYELIDPYINDPVNSYFIYTGRNLSDVINMYLTKSGCGLTYESKFFNDDINPVTGQTNKLKNLQINNCSDIKTNQTVAGFLPATILNMTFKNLLENLSNFFNVHWHIDGNVFRIEHLSYYENGYTYAVNQQNVNNLVPIINDWTNRQEIIKTNNYKYNVEKIFNKERWSSSQFFYYDFSDIIIKYDIAGDQNENLYSTDFYTDVSALFSFPDNFSNQGTVLIAIREQIVDISNNATGYVIINEVGARTNELAINGHLSWSNLLPAYWYNGRVLIRGELMGEIVTFLSQVNKKIQSLTIKDCNDEIHVPELAITNLGNGRIVKTSWDIVKRTKQIEIEL